MQTTLAIPLSLVLVAALLLWMIILGRGHWTLKSLAVSVSIYYSVCLFLGVRDIMGWPCEAELPERFVIKQAVINEPSKVGSGEGDIVIWLVAIDEKFAPAEQSASWLPFGRAGKPGDPRSIRIPYSQKMHESVQKAMEMGREGRAVYMERGRLSEKRGDGKEGMSSLSRDTEFIPHMLPPPSIPEKVTN